MFFYVYVLPRTRGRLAGISTGLEASHENLLSHSNCGHSNGQSREENQNSEKIMLNLEMVTGFKRMTRVGEDRKLWGFNRINCGRLLRLRGFDNRCQDLNGDDRKRQNIRGYEKK